MTSDEGRPLCLRKTNNEIYLILHYENSTTYFRKFSWV